MTNVVLSGEVCSDDSFDARFNDYFDIPYISPSVVQDIIDNSSNGPIEIDLDSGGGEVFAASTIADKLKRCKNQVNINITGLAASAASVIAMAGDKVSIANTAMIMIHNASSIVMGNNNDMQHEADVLTKINNSIANAYVDKTGIDKAKILDLMDKESWITCDEAKELGFVDEILDKCKKKNTVTNSIFGSNFTDTTKKKFNEFKKSVINTNKTDNEFIDKLQKLREAKMAIAREE